MPLSAADIKAQMDKGERRKSINSSVLLYGAPKTGKTALAATVAKMESIKQVIWFDFERGSDTIFSGQAGLTEEEMGKIIPIFFQDTAEYPIAAETALKALTAKNGVTINCATGKVGPVANKDLALNFKYSALGEDTAVVFDTVSQLADSVFNLQLAQFEYKDPRKYWGHFHTDMNAIFSCIQASRAVNILIAQEGIIEGTTKADTVNRSVTKTTDGQAKKSAVMVSDDRMVPICGSLPYSQKVAKYPSTVARLYIERKIYKGLSTPTTIANVIGGSRFGVDISTITKPTMEDLIR